MYPPTPNHYRESQTTSDFESSHFCPPKQIVGAEFYGRSKPSRKLCLLGVGLTALVDGLYIVVGFMIYVSKSTMSSGIVVASLGKGVEKEVLSLVLNLVVTLCTEVTGFAHRIALRSALASEKRLRFNTNLRLISAASGWFNPNGTLLSIVMITLLVLSYSSSLMLILPATDFISPASIYVNDVPLIVLGIALLSQTIIALACVWAAWSKILTWSSSPFDLTAALIHHTQITPVPGWCMRSICDDVSPWPVTPSKKQPSAWRAHPSIRKIVMTLWVLVVVCIAWGLVAAYLSDHDISHTFQSWSFFPQSSSHSIAYGIHLAPTRGVYKYWVLCYSIMVATQAPLTLVLHCSELVVNVIRDKQIWKRAMTKEGTTISSNPLAPIFGSPLSLTLFLAKPLLHWMFGLAVSLTEVADSDSLVGIAVRIWPLQILNYTAALLIVSLVFTIIVFLQPEGPQPAAYGHVQTLANLMDEFPSSGIMWWGDKGCEGTIRSAGTSERLLPKVVMNALYA